MGWSVLAHLCWFLSGLSRTPMWQLPPWRTRWMGWGNALYRRKLGV